MRSPAGAGAAGAAPAADASCWLPVTIGCVPPLDLEAGQLERDAAGRTLISEIFP